MKKLQIFEARSISEVKIFFMISKQSTKIEYVQMNADRKEKLQ